MDMVVVFDTKTKRLVPFAYNDDGTIVITASGVINDEHLIVTTVSSEDFRILNFQYLDRSLE